jgi:capsular polysaccharide biosynthesis protein
VAGAAYVFVEPPPLSSTTLVLLPTPALAESSSSDVETQVRIALSATILERAGQAVEPKLSLRKVEKMVDVSAPTNQLLQIKVTSTKAAEAQALSQAAADAYVGYVSDTAREVTQAALADLNVRKDQLEEQINNKLQGEIAATAKRQRATDPNSPDGRAEARLLAGLRTEQADLSLQLDKVKDKIATGAPVGGSTAGTAVIQKATEAEGPSTLLRLLTWPLFGAAAFTIVVAAILLALSLRDTRVRLRDEIADAVGSPVLAAVRSRPQRSVAGWSTLLETYDATPVEAWAFRRILRGLVASDRRTELRASGKFDHPKSLTVVSLSGDGRGLAIGAQLAAFAASLGVTTRLVTGVGDEKAAALWAACAAEHEAQLRRGLYVGDTPDTQAIDMTITLVVADRRHPNLREAPASTATILSVASATATEQELARVAVALDDTGRRIDGIVVADPDQTDRTSGRHTMDERSRKPALPTRLTGVTSFESAASARNRSR